ncbi:MAG TPA: hypothetical protein VKB51_12530 [bacterium]|nr:hypothetical protein [bacterium]
MAEIRREWLRRIPGWVWSEQPPSRRRVRRDDDGDEGERLGETDDADADAMAEAEDGDEAAPDDDGEAQAQGGGTPQPGNADGEPDGDAQAGEADDAADAEPPDELSLEIPDEVEQRRREEERKRRRGALNLGEAPQAFGLEGHYLRNLATRFARMISKVAEDSADLPSEGDEEWDMNELIRRRFTGRLIGQCRMTREKRKVAVVLDTSPSCEHQARLFGSIARIAEELGDCEIYDAPNFIIHSRKLDGEWEVLPEAEREWQFKGRVVLAFGDFDGIDRICQASQVRGNRIYWFCCEERPSVLEHGRETFVKKFRGHYHPATHLGQLMNALRRVR